MKRVLQFFILTFLLLSFFSCGKNPDKEVSYEGVSFKYPSYWKIETEKSESGNIYIDASEKFDKETIFLVSIVQKEMEPQEIIDNYLGKLSKDFDVEKEPAESAVFAQYKALSVKYKMSKLRSKAYGVVYAFNKDGRTILLIKQSEKEYDLKHEKYKLMEDSFSFVATGDSIP